MPRPLRESHPGDFFHVVNHGQAHAPLFETAADTARLLSLLGWATVEGWIRVLAYCVLATHFHLILQTVDGRLADAMQRIEGSFGTWHNRTRSRVGHVVKGRYHARPLMPGVDLAVALAYVDWNPVAARICASPDAYPHGSAHAYVHGGGPGWLARDDVESLICRLTDRPRFEGRLYPSLWTWARRVGAQSIVTRAMHGTPTVLQAVPVLASAGPEHVQRWLREHLEREEGRARPTLLIEPLALLSAVTADSSAPRDELVAGLLSQLAGCSSVEISGLLAISQPTAFRRIREHRRQLLSDGTYAEHAARLTQHLLRGVYGTLAVG